MATHAGVLVFSGLSPTDALPDGARPLEAVLEAENVRVTTKTSGVTLRPFTMSETALGDKSKVWWFRFLGITGLVAAQVATLQRWQDGDAASWIAEATLPSLTAPCEATMRRLVEGGLNDLLRAAKRKVDLRLDDDISGPKRTVRRRLGIAL